MPDFQQPERKPETPPAGPPITKAELVGQAEPEEKPQPKGKGKK